jgi:hypothetical protein
MAGRRCLYSWGRDKKSPDAGATGWSVEQPSLRGPGWMMLRIYPHKPEENRNYWGFDSPTFGCDHS